MDEGRVPGGVEEGDLGGLGGWEVEAGDAGEFGGMVWGQDEEVEFGEGRAVEGGNSFSGAGEVFGGDFEVRGKVEESDWEILRIVDSVEG